MSPHPDTDLNLMVRSQELAEVDPYQAAETARRISDEFSRANHLAGIAVKWYDRDPQFALDTARTTGVDTYQADALAGIGRLVANRNPSLAQTLLTEIRALAVANARDQIAKGQINYAAGLLEYEITRMR